MENREFDQLSADIREYTLRFQEAMLHFFRDSIIRRIYGSGNDLQKVLDEYNNKNSKFGILNENIGDGPLDKDPYGRMDFAAAIKILRYINLQGKLQISQDFTNAFEIENISGFAKKLKIGNKSRNIFAHYNENKKISFTKDNMKESMLFFIDMVSDIKSFSAKGNDSFLQEKEETLQLLNDIYRQAMLHTNLLCYSLQDVMAITGRDEKTVRMQIENYDILRDGNNLYSEDCGALQSMIESIRKDRPNFQIKDFFPVNVDEAHRFSIEEMQYVAAKTVFIIDFSALLQNNTYLYLRKYAALHFQIWDTVIYIDVNSLEKAKLAAYETSMPIKQRYRKNAKECFKKITELREYLRVQYIADEFSVENKIEEVIEQFGEKTRICIMTGDRDTIDRVWKLGKSNVVVLSSDANGLLTVNQGKENQIVSYSVLEQFRNVRVDLKNYTNKEETFMSEYTPRVEETMDSIIKIQGGIPNRGLYAPQMGYTFDYYERGKEQGAEGTVFLTNRGDFVVKIFHEHANTIGKRERIKAMLTKNINKEYICWPEDILLSSENNGEFVGYVMKHVRRPESLSDKIEELDLLSKTGDSKYDRRFLMQYCRKIAEQFRELHENNILVGDVNETNILVSSEDEEVYFVDTDSYQFDDYKALVGQEVYTSPEYMENSDDSEQLSYDKPRTIKDEQFAMAVMFYRILFLGAWPFKMCEGHVAEEIRKRAFHFTLQNVDVDSVSEQAVRESLIWNETPDFLREMFVRTFCSSKRYNADEWVYAFNNAENEISIGNCSKDLVPGWEVFIKSKEELESLKEVKQVQKVQVKIKDNGKKIESVNSIPKVQQLEPGIHNVSKKEDSQTEISIIQQSKSVTTNTQSSQIEMFKTKSTEAESSQKEVINTQELEVEASQPVHNTNRTVTYVKRRHGEKNKLNDMPVTNKNPYELHENLYDENVEMPDTTINNTSYSEGDNSIADIVIDKPIKFPKKKGEKIAERLSVIFNIVMFVCLAVSIMMFAEEEKIIMLQLLGGSLIIWLILYRNKRCLTKGNCIYAILVATGLFICSFIRMILY